MILYVSGDMEDDHQSYEDEAVSILASYNQVLAFRVYMGHEQVLLQIQTSRS